MFVRRVECILQPRFHSARCQPKEWLHWFWVVCVCFIHNLFDDSQRDIIIAAANLWRFPPLTDSCLHIVLNRKFGIAERKLCTYCRGSAKNRTKQWMGSFVRNCKKPWKQNVSQRPKTRKREIESKALTSNRKSTNAWQLSRTVVSWNVRQGRKKKYLHERISPRKPRSAMLVQCLQNTRIRKWK